MRSRRIALLLVCGVLLALAALALRHRQRTEGASDLAASEGPAAERLRESTPVAQAPVPADPDHHDGVSTSPDHARLPSALVAACREPDPERRTAAITAALRNWAAQDVDAAGAWARTQSYVLLDLALAAVVNGAAAGNPDSAERFVNRLSEAEPERATDYGSFLVFALGEIGEHARAAAWTARVSEPPSDWLILAYGRWADKDPRMAWHSLSAIEEAQSRRTAMYAVLRGWARAQPRDLADTAKDFPTGPERNFALVTALRSWAEKDPGQASAWMFKHRDAVAGIPHVDTILED